MESLWLEEVSIMKDITNLFRLKKELNYTPIKNVINPFRLEKSTKANKDRILRDIKNLPEHEEEENYYKPVRVGYFWSKNFIEYESNSNKNNTPSHDEYCNNIRPYLKDNLEKSDTRKIQLIIANNFFHRY